MEDEDAEEYRSDSTNASPNRVSNADWNGLSGFGQQDGAKHVKEGESCYPSPKFGAINKFSFTEAESEACFTEAGDDKDDPIHDLIS